jgi:hypothetical protein
VKGTIISLAVVIGAGFGCSGAAAATPSITAVSVCGALPQGTVGQAVPSASFTSNCRGGTFDSGQQVLAPDGSGRSINAWGSKYASDEHSSVLPPVDWAGDGSYLFFVASGPNPSSCCGVQALSSVGKGPNALGQWTFHYAPGYGNGAQIFTPPGPFGTCDGHDERFDLNYAAAGSVVPDPDSPGSVLMVYESTNKCPSTSSQNDGRPGGSGQPNGYHMVGIATSSNDGMSWPAYPSSDPPGDSDWKDFWFGVGTARYPVLAPSTSLYDLFRAGRAAAPALRHEQEPSAFLDTTQPGTPFLYVLVGAGYLSRAQVTSPSTPLAFYKWDDGQWNGPPSGEAMGGNPPDPLGNLNDTQDVPVWTPDGKSRDCGAPSQQQQGFSLSYLAATRQYLLLFVCVSSHDPRRAPGESKKVAHTKGAAWFWATTTPGSSTPTDWTALGEISGSWSNIVGGRYTGWYPTIMSLRQQPGQLTTTGYVFYMAGCLGKAGCTNGVKSRTYSSREFVIRTTNDVYSRPPTTRIVPTAAPTGVRTFTLTTNSPGSAFTCRLDGKKVRRCSSYISVDTPGSHTLSARATNPFGVSGRIATFKFFVINRTPPVCKVRCPQPI